MQDRKLFMKYITGLGELHNKELSSVLIEMYWHSLSAFSDEQCKAAFDRAVVKCKFFPKPAELIEDIEPPTQYLAHRQAGYFVAILEGVGYRNPAGWDEDPTTKKLLEGRFRGIYQRAKEDDIKWIEKEFISAYLDSAEYITHTEQQKLDAPPEIKQLVKGIG